MNVGASDRQALVALSLAIQAFALVESNERILKLWKLLDTREATDLLDKYTSMGCEASFHVMKTYNFKGQLN
jgi:hypothetical protein